MGEEDNEEGATQDRPGQQHSTNQQPCPCPCPLNNGEARRGETKTETEQKDATLVPSREVEKSPRPLELVLASGLVLFFNTRRREEKRREREERRERKQRIGFEIRKRGLVCVGKGEREEKPVKGSE